MFIAVLFLVKKKKNRKEILFKGGSREGIA